MLSIVTIAYAVADIPELEELTLECVEQTAVSTMGEFEHIVIFNGKPTGICESKFIAKSLVYHRHQGIASCYNEGFKEAEGDILCCMHNDIFPLPGWDGPLIDIAEQGAIGFPTIEEVRFKGTWPLGSACFMMSRKTWNKLGGYDEAFEGCHYEDEDLFYRAEQEGIGLLRSKSSRVKHLRRMTRSLVPWKQDEYWMGINARVYIKKHGDAGKAWTLARWKGFKCEEITPEERANSDSDRVQQEV